jgi:hypothetical protein
MIVLVGNKQAMADQLRRRFPGLAIRFIDEHRSEVEFPRKTEHVILSRWSGHRWRESARRALDADQVHYCRGGLTQITGLIATIAAGVGGRLGTPFKI